jgi:ribonuclease R
MIAANEAVADHLATRGADALYRVHDAPDPVKLEALGSFVEHFGFELHRDRPEVASREIQKLLESTEGRPEARVISQVALRTMSQARYSTENAGHFALAAPSYGHFTSPIRRYPDLIVHRQLRALRTSQPAPHDHDGLVTIADSSSTLERAAESAERELLSWKKVAFIADHVGESFEGIVTGVTRFGLFVQLIENLVEGLVRVELLGSEWFDFDERRFELIGSRSGTTYRLGDPLEVQVTRVDRVLQRVDFVPQNGTPTPVPAPRHEQQRRQPRFRSDRRRAPRRR